MFKKTLIFYSLSIYTVYASDYGTTGLIDTPTARMQQDGTLSLTAAYDNYAQSYSLTYQLLPRIEGTYRYTGLNDFFHWDRNYEVKLQLIEESQYLPALAIGVRDLVGTGIYGSEYVVGSKYIGDFDFSLGVGWGRLAGDGLISNPLTLLHEGFGTRVNDFGKGGTFSTGTFFRGEKVGIFGGISYSLPNYPLNLTAEYNPDLYSWEVGRGSLAPKTPFSFAADWEIAPSYKLSVSHQHGDRFGLSLTKTFNTKEAPPKTRPSPLIAKHKQNLTSSKQPSWVLQTSDSLLNVGVIPKSLYIDEEANRAEVELYRGAYRYWPDAINNAHTQVSATLPLNIRNVDYLVKEAGMTMQTIRMPRNAVSTSFDTMTVSEDATVLQPRIVNSNAYTTDDFYDNDLTFSAYVDANFHLFDPDNPLGYEFYAGLGSAFPIGGGWNGLGVYEIPLYDNLEENTRVSDSVLPHVRSDVAQYLKNGGSRISILRADKRSTLSPKLHYRLFGGILEKMYSGVGGELLYQPNDSRLAFGISGAYVKQRDFNGLFGHTDYEVATGHASLFWATPFYNYDMAAHLGRYLAKDIGGTLEVRRTFSNGWSIGLWGTLTDVPFDTFGEGSFDKGIYLQIPLGFNITGGVGSGFNARIRPIQRDGGARLEDYSGQLWWDGRAARKDVFQESFR